MNAACINWPGGLMAGALFLGLQSMLAGPSDTEAAQDTAAEVRAMELQIDATQHRLDQAAIDVCRQVAGPGSVPVERINGEIGCMPKGAL